MTNPLTSRGKVMKLSGGSGSGNTKRSDNGRAPDGGQCQTRRFEVTDANAPVAATERQNTSSRSSAGWFFLESVALYAASYYGLPSSIPKSDSEFSTAESLGPKRNVAACERDKPIYRVVSPASPKAAVIKDQIDTDPLP